MNGPLINKVLNPPRVTGATWLADLAALFMPRLCSGCNNGLMPFEQGLCLECLRDLPLARFTNDPDNPVAMRFQGRVPLEHASALLHFTPGGKVQHLLHRLKYKADHHSGRIIGRLMAEDILRSGRFTSVDAMVPVPLHRRKERQRGYNQSLVLAEGMRSGWDRPIVHTAVQRITRTSSQTRRGRWDRWHNVKTAFHVPAPAQIEGKHLLLIDDVVTTGATAEACAAVLLAVPGVRVSLYTAAFA